METYSLRLEHLLCKLSPEMRGMRGVIAKNPYKTILSTLNGRVSKISLEKFIISYQAIDGKSISELQNEGYNIEILISDLINIIQAKKE